MRGGGPNPLNPEKKRALVVLVVLIVLVYMFVSKVGSLKQARQLESVESQYSGHAMDRHPGATMSSSSSSHVAKDDHEEEEEDVVSRVEKNPSLWAELSSQLPAAALRLTSNEMIPSSSSSSSSSWCPMGISLPPQVVLLRTNVHQTSLHGYRASVAADSSPDTLQRALSHIDTMLSIVQIHDAHLGKSKSCTCIDATNDNDDGIAASWLAGAGCRVYGYQSNAQSWRRAYSAARSHATLWMRMWFWRARVGDVCDPVANVRRIDDDEFGAEGQLGIWMLRSSEASVWRGAVRLMRTRPVVWIHAPKFNAHPPASDVDVDWLYLMAVLDYEIYMQPCPPEHIVADEGKLCVQQRVFVDQLREKLSGKESHLLLFNRNAFRRYTS